MFPGKSALEQALKAALYLGENVLHQRGRAPGELRARATILNVV